MISEADQNGDNEIDFSGTQPNNFLCERILKERSSRV